MKEKFYCPACDSSDVEPLNQADNGTNYNCLKCGQRFIVQHSSSGPWIIVHGDLIVKKGLNQRHNITVIGSVIFEER